MNETPLHYAAIGNSIEIGELLLSKESEVNAKNNNYYLRVINFLVNMF